jgi:hypothetical protein
MRQKSCTLDLFVSCYTENLFCYQSYCSRYIYKIAHQYNWEFERGVIDNL